MLDSEELNDKELDTDDNKSSDKKKSRKKDKVDKSELIKAQEERDALNEKFMRLYAEFENYKKRTAKERLELLQTASKSLVVNILPVLDDFERALEVGKNSQDVQSLIEGQELVFKKLYGIMQAEGLKPIEAKGKEFDTDFHEAITKVPTEDKSMKGKVVDEIEKGYLLNDRVVRYSKVIIGE